MAITPDSTILQEEIDECYEPTEEEILEFASWLGMQLPKEKSLLWIAEKGLKAPLPSEWKPCTTDEDEIYYFNFETGESSWDHPCDEIYRKLYQEEKSRLEAELQHRSDAGRKPVLPSPNSASPRFNGSNGSPKAIPHNGTSPGVPSPRTRSKAEFPKQPEPLVIKWKSAMRGEEQAAEMQKQQQQKPSSQHVTMSRNADEDRVIGSSAQRDEGLDHTEQRTTDQTEQRKFVPSEQRKFDHEQLKFDASKIDPSEQRKFDPSEQLHHTEHRKFEPTEKRKLEEAQKQKMEQELEAEKEKLLAERKDAWETKLREEEEQSQKMNQELNAMRKKRKQELSEQLELELKVLKDESQKRLEAFRKELQEEEMRKIENERDKMLAGIRQEAERNKLALVEDKKEEVLSRMKQVVNTLEKNIFERELESVGTRVREDVERARLEMKIRVEKEVEAELNSFKEQMLKLKREQVMQEVQDMLERQRHESYQQHLVSSPSPRPSKVDDLRRSGSGNISVDAEPMDFQQQQCRGSGCELGNVLHKAACEVLLSLVVRNKQDGGGCACCQEKFLDLKRSISRLEEDILETRRMVASSSSSSQKKPEPAECRLL